MRGDVWVVLPLACLAGGAFAIYLVARLLTARNELLALLTALVFATALGALAPLFRLTRAGYLPRWGHFGSGGAFLRADPGALMVAGVALGLGMLVTVYSGRYLAFDGRHESYYPLLLLLVTGLVGMVMAADLFNLYMFCELMSIAAYVLVAFRHRLATAIEAGFKYLIMGSVGTVTILMGLSFVYRETGTLALPFLLPPQVGGGGGGARGPAPGWPVSWWAWASRAPSCPSIPGCPMPTDGRPAASAPCSPASSFRAFSMRCSRSAWDWDFRRATWGRC
ncbi:MAG: hypothetical protein H8D78_09615 [Chloroflexi bacterium]|nr:hypothetical protein [Chloroflexota bacterium]